MKKIIYILAVLILCFMTTNVGTVKAATTITVPDDYPTIQQAITAANPGDTVYVRAGTYTENLIVAKPLTLEGENKDTTSIQAQSQSPAINITNTSGVTINNLTVKNDGRIGINVYNCSDVSLVGNNIHGKYREAVKIQNCSDVSLLGNNIYDSNRAGISFLSSINSIISNNTIFNNQWHGIYISGSNGNTIKGNTISKNGYSTPGTFCGIFVVNAKSNEIYNNNFIDNAVHAMTSFDCSGTVFNLAGPVGGNYWDTWTTPDGDGDGFVDFPYIYAGVKDYLPWAKQGGWKNSPATVDIKPDTLNLDSKGKWITAYIELEEGSDVADIDISTVKLNDAVSAELKPSGIGDYDEDGIPDLMVKFDRASVQEVLEVGDEVGVIITGKLTGGASFKGTDTIRVIGEGGG